jgi:predicted PurR-regulated permease PerM
MTETMRWQGMGLVAIIAVLLYLLGPILTPFAVSALLAYLGDPLTDRLQSRGLSRNTAVTVVFALMTLTMVGVVVLLIPLLSHQLENFFSKLPDYLRWFQVNAFPYLEKRFGVSLEQLQPERLVEMLREHWRAAGGIAASVIGYVSKSGLRIVEGMMTIFLIPVVTFYFLRDWDGLVVRVRELLPRHLEPTISQLARESDNVLGAFLRGQVSVMVVLGLLYSLGLWAVGIDFAILIGMGAGMVSFVPYLGAIVGVMAGVIAALVQYGDWLHLLLVLGVFGIGHMIESWLLTPWLVGDRIGLHPVAVIFSILAGGQLFGFLGVLLALPVAAVCMVVLRHLHRRYLQSELYGQPLTPLFETENGAAEISPPAVADNGQEPAEASAPPK